LTSTAPHRSSAHVLHRACHLRLKCQRRRPPAPPSSSARRADRPWAPCPGV
jgi:hypothetical protein